MRTRRNLSILIFSLAAAACLIAYMLSGPAQGTVTAQDDGEAASSSEPLSETAVPANPAAPAAPQEENAPEALISWRITGSALRPRRDDVSYAASSGGGCVYVTSGNTFTVWNVPVNLPQGSTINSLRMYYSDTSDSAARSWFSIYDLYGNLVEEWSVDSVGNSGDGFNDSALIDHTIDYSMYSYAINWRPNDSGSGMNLCGFRVFYEPPPFGLNYLPAVIN